MFGECLGLGVTTGNLSFYLHLRVGQPARDLLHKDQINHVTLKPVYGSGKVKVLLVLLITPNKHYRQYSEQFILLFNNIQ